MFCRFCYLGYICPYDLICCRLSLSKHSSMCLIYIYYSHRLSNTLHIDGRVTIAVYIYTQREITWKLNHQKLDHAKIVASRFMYISQKTNAFYLGRFSQKYTETRPKNSNLRWLFLWFWCRLRNKQFKLPENIMFLLWSTELVSGMTELCKNSSAQKVNQSIN